MSTLAELRLFYKASLERGYGSKSIGSHERLELGDIVQKLLPRDFSNYKFLHDRTCPSGFPTFFAISAIIGDDTRCPWVQLKYCTPLSMILHNQVPDLTLDPIMRVSVPPLHQFDNNNAYFARLTSAVKKVGVLHDCSSSDGCVFSVSTKSVQHSTCTSNGGTFFIFVRSMGYPPRKS